MSDQKVSVIGAGAWGTALAANAARGGRKVRIWARKPEHAEEIRKTSRNDKYLPGIDLPTSVVATSDLDVACEHADIILLCVPAQTLSPTVQRCALHTSVEATFVSCAKGIDRATGKTMTEVISGHSGGREIAVLSGPSFAADVARFLPTAVTIASADEETALELAKALSNDTLRCYAASDVRGVELGGALKNVLAIAAGITRGRRLGASAEAALIARGFAEMTRIATAMGARPETMAGLAGLGDLVLTCSSDKSRNFAFGVAIGTGLPVDDLPLAEGAKTAEIASYLARRDGISAPVTGAVADILKGALTVDDAIASLFARPIKSE
ncbi:MAG: NAD(P)H-dependent glycerol-3-phosphate dehydrogenase [Pseudomonadota bacterium]